MAEGRRKGRKPVVYTEVEENGSFQENVVDSSTDSKSATKEKKGRSKKEPVAKAVKPVAEAAKTVKSKGRAKKAIVEEPDVEPPIKRSRKKAEPTEKSAKKKETEKETNGNAPEAEVDGEIEVPKKKTKAPGRAKKATKAVAQAETDSNGAAETDVESVKEEETAEKEEPVAEVAPSKGRKRKVAENKKEPEVEVVKEKAKAPGRAAKKATSKGKPIEEVVEEKPKKRARKNTVVDNDIDEVYPESELNGIEEVAKPAAAKKGRKKVEKPESEQPPAEKKPTKERAKKRAAEKVEDDAEESNNAEESTDEPKRKAKDESSKAKQPKLNSVTTLYKDIDFGLDKPHNLKISSWNVAGLRSWLTKGGLDYIDHEKPDIICLQETKCTEDQLPENARIAGYHPYWLCPKGGHAGIALYSKIMPINVEYGIGDTEQDEDGRILTAEYEKYYVISVYVTNAGRKLVTLGKRLRWNNLFEEYITKLDAKKPVIICGDMNVAHQEIDLTNPKTNQKNAGFTKEERQGMTKLLSLGFVDTFRHFYPSLEKSYTFWSYMGNARAKNVGWRLDYFIVSSRIINKMVDNVIRTDVKGSDHCPITLFAEF